MKRKFTALARIEMEVEYQAEVSDEQYLNNRSAALEEAEKEAESKFRETFAAEYGVDPAKVDVLWDEIEDSDIPNGNSSRVEPETKIRQLIRKTYLNAFLYREDIAAENIVEHLQNVAGDFVDVQPEPKILTEFYFEAGNGCNDMTEGDLRECLRNILCHVWMDVCARNRTANGKLFVKKPKHMSDYGWKEHVAEAANKYANSFKIHGNLGKALQWWSDNHG